MIPCAALTMLSFFIQSKDDHRHLILHTENRSCHIHNRQFLIDHFLNAHLIIFHGIRMVFRITVIHAVYCFRQQDCFRLNLYRPQHSRRVGGKIRMTRSACKNTTIL